MRNRDEWLAIDPKGVIGEPAYEVAAFIRNPIPDLLKLPYTQDIVLSRISAFSHNLGLPKERIKKRCYVQAVLCWA